MVETGMTCPFCGGIARQCGHTGRTGKREFSLCCGKGWMLFANYEMLAALPDGMMQMAIDADRKEEDAYYAHATGVQNGYRAYMESETHFRIEEILDRLRKEVERKQNANRQ